jgi:hypothetical protein
VADWRQVQVGWRLAASQLPPLETTAACSLLLLQKSVGVFGFFSFLFFLNTINAKQ